MNPDSNVNAQLRLAASLLRPNRFGIECVEKEEMLNEAEQLAELVLAFDGWRKTGGRLPRRWSAKMRRIE
jgi:hypothetical protein